MRKMTVKVKREDYNRSLDALKALYGVVGVDNQDVFLDNKATPIIPIDVYFHSGTADKLVGEWRKVAEAHRIWTEVV